MPGIAPGRNDRTGEYGFPISATWYLVHQLPLDGQRYRVTTGTRDKRLAGVKLKDLELKLFKGELGAPITSTAGASLPEFLRRFIDYARANYAGQHLQSDLSRIANMQEFFARKGVKRLKDISPGLIEEFMTVTLEGRSPKTRKNYLALLKTILNYAVKWGVIDRNPITQVRPPKIVKKFRFFSREEVSRLIKEAQEPLRTAIIILVNTGLRRAELFNLRWRDVDLKAGSLRVWPYDGFTPKGKRPRSIPLNEAAQKTIEKLKSNPTDPEYVFRPFKSMFAIYERFSGLLAALGMKGTLHDLRHTFASHLAMSGTPIPVIKEILGHSDIATTMIYAHLSPEQHKGEVNKLNFPL